MNEQQSFLDPKTLLAIFLLGAVWIGWQFHLKEKYPDAYKTQEVSKDKSANQISGSQVEVTSLDSGGKASYNKEIMAKGSSVESSPVEQQKETFVTFEDDNWSFTMSSFGMGLKDIRLKTYTDRDGNPKLVGAASDDLAFSTRVIGRRTPINFAIERVGEDQFVGRGEFGGLKIVKKVLVNSKNYTLDTKIFVNGVDDTFSGLETKVVDLISDIESTSFFMPQFERQEIYVEYDGQEERVFVQKDEHVNQSFSKVGVIGLSTQYFALAVLDKSNIMPELNARVDKSNKVSAFLNHNVLNRSSEFNVHYVAFAGPKSIQLLNAIDNRMASLVDFGMFSMIGRIILKVMKGFYSLVGNWGIAIVLLTLLVRLVVFPFNVMSYKSMKAMQKIQPRLKAIKEKYSDDKVKLNQETMALMKEANANPLGGCLPMLLQFPIFIALYQVIGQSIELYQAPFGFWISDLSLKDPYYVLPVLMGITIFLQQKMTPSNMDPTQQKIMMFMPLMFMVFMVSLPSGLTLYMFVSALFAVVQQTYFMREPAAAKA